MVQGWKWHTRAEAIKGLTLGMSQIFIQKENYISGWVFRFEHQAKWVYQCHLAIRSPYMKSSIENFAGVHMVCLKECLWIAHLSSFWTV